MNEQHPLWNSVSCLVVAVLAIVAFVRGAWELPLLAAAFIGWGAWVLWTQVLPALRSGRRIHASEKTRRTKEATLHPRQDETAARKAEEEMARTLLRYVNRRISDQLKAVNPNIRWEWEEKNPALLAVRGGIGRIRLYGIPDYCHADVDLNPDGTLTCALIKTVSEPETEDGRVLDPSEAQKADPQAWYAPYGYSKSKEDRHRLVANPETAPIVQEIFSLRLQGMGYAGIARTLNARGIPSPGAYLFQQGLSERENYRDSMWAVWNIKEILSSEAYLGHLIQGKRTQASYKQSRKERYAPADEWRICRNVHEPLIDSGTFAAVQKMAGESRQRYASLLGKADEWKTPNLFRKLIYCADCGKAMSRRHIYSNWGGERQYYYNFYCPTSTKLSSACTPKNLSETKLLEIVTDTIFAHLAAVAKLEHLVNEVWDEKTSEERTAVAQRITDAERELSRYAKLLEGLYERLAEGLISRQEYQSLKEHYHSQYREAKARYDALKQQEQDIHRFGPSNPMFRACRPLYAASELTEELVHTLIARISVHDHNCIDISLVYQDEFFAAARFLEGVTKP